MCLQNVEVHQDRYTRTLIHIVGIEQPGMDRLVQNRRARPVGGPTKRGEYRHRGAVNKNKNGFTYYR